MWTQMHDLLFFEMSMWYDWNQHSLHCCTLKLLWLAMTHNPWGDRSRIHTSFLSQNSFNSIDRRRFFPNSPAIPWDEPGVMAKVVRNSLVTYYIVVCNSITGVHWTHIDYRFPISQEKNIDTTPVTCPIPSGHDLLRSLGHFWSLQWQVGRSQHTERTTLESSRLDPTDVLEDAASDYHNRM